MSNNDVSYEDGREFDRPNQKAQEALQNLRDRQGHQTIHAIFCTKVDQFNAPFNCKQCAQYMFNCSGRPQK